MFFRIVGTLLHKYTTPQVKDHVTAIET
jgi:hypothetical protein